MPCLTTPLQAGSLMLTNRLVMPPMATGKTQNGHVNKALLDYYHEKSSGGYLSLIIIEHSYVNQNGKAHPGQISVADDQTIPGLKSLADAIHQNGCKTVMQINHAGSAAAAAVTGSLPLGPSAISHPMNSEAPKEMTQQEIAEIVQVFREAACRVREAGFDGVEIHSAHGYLLNQFFSPLSNKRTDEYGGSVQNRIRIHLEILDAIRTAVGKDFPLLLRLGACDFKEGGITIEDSQSAAQAFEKASVDILDITGSFSGFNAPPGASGQGYFSTLTSAIKQVVSIPVILTGGITEPQAAEQLLAERKADLIGVGRAVLQDSLWARRAIEALTGKP